MLLGSILVGSSLAHAARPFAVTIEVTARDGGSVPTASVEDAVGARHATDDAGTWTTTTVPWADDVEIRELMLVPRMQVPFVVTAPGYAPRAVEVAVRRAHWQRVEVQLDPLGWADDGPDLERRVRAEVEAWRVASEAFVAAPSEAAAQRRERARRRVEQLSEDWLVWIDQAGADRRLAESVCRSSARHPRRCLP